MPGFIECAVTSCKSKLEGDAANPADARKLGWKSIKDSNQPPAAKAGRLAIGWCPDCASKYDVSD